MRLSTLSIWLVFLSLFLAPASAQWMFERKPSADDSALELAGYVPAEVVFTTGFQLTEQIDLKALAIELKRGLSRLQDGPSQVASLERFLSAPLEDWVGHFSGRGYLALLDPQAMSPSENWVLALGLERPGAIRDWLEALGHEPSETIGGFELYEVGGQSLGIGRGWLFLSRTPRTSQLMVKALSGSGRGLGQDATFTRARNCLTGGQSGLFFYLDGDRLRRSLYQSVALANDHPARRSLGFWDFAIVSLDFAKEEADGFLGYAETQGTLATALRKPGRISTQLFESLPNQFSGGSAYDVRWTFNVLQALGEEVPEFGVLFGSARSALSQYGDFDQAFGGTLVVGSNALDTIARYLRYDLVATRRRAQLAGCRLNLQQLSTGLETYFSEHEGNYPKRLADLVPGYLLSIPTCPTEGAEPYRYQFESPPIPSYLLSCVGHQHPMLKTQPLTYSSSEGFIESDEGFDAGSPEVGTGLAQPSFLVAVPVESVTHAQALLESALSADKERKAAGLLDGELKVLRLAYGPQADELLVSPRGAISSKPVLLEASRWGADSAIYLDYVDMGPLYQAAEEALDQGVLAGSQQAAIILDMLKALRGQVRGIDGSTCVKVTEQGLHLRTRGIMSSRFLVAGLLGSAVVGVPNFSRAKAQGQLTDCKVNLKKIATALEIWSVDHEGKYPESLTPLVGEYLTRIPDCPAAAQDTYSATYRRFTDVESEVESYEVYCQGHHHAKVGVEIDYPRYSGVSGLLERP